ATPAIMLFLNHIKYNKGKRLNVRNGNFIYNNLSETIEFTLKDIKKVEVYLTPPSYDKRVDFLYLGSFFYTSIYTLKGDRIELSSLIFNAYDEFFPEDLIERKKKLFPFMSNGPE
ncbi:MAG: hypothetical protein AAGF77_02755, partial [Bacteroidota bacterium]